MKIPEFGSLEMTRTHEAHYGANFDSTKSIGNSARTSMEKTRMSFEDYLIDAVKSVNQKQLDLASVQEKIITSPDEVDIHEVTIAMSKAQLSLNIAQTVIDRLVQGWSEISTTR